MTIRDKNIKVLVNKRKEILKQHEDSCDEKISDYTIEEPEEIFTLRDEILNLIFKYEPELDTDCIIETMTELGYAPNILYDDNGNFAVITDCFTSVSFGDDPVDMDMSFHVEARHWKPTIREAIKHYLEDFDPELWLKTHREKKINKIWKNHINSFIYR